MRHARTRRAALTLLPICGLLTLPGAASAAITGHHGGYSVTFRGGMATITLPTPAKRLVPVEVACGRAGQEESVVAIAPLSSGSRTLTAPGPAPTSSRCIIRRNHHRVAVIHVHTS